MAKGPNLYALLGIFRSSTQEEIRRAYLKAAKKLHPDKNQNPGETELFLGIQEAYQVLSDPERRTSYDATLPKEEEVVSPIKHEILLSRKMLNKLEEPQLIYAMITLGLSDEQLKQVNTPTLNLCLAIDCSTSMKGEKLDTVKRAAAQILKKLRPQDIISVVSFSDRAEVIIPATRHVDAHRANIKVQMLQTSGGTEIMHGLEAGYHEVVQYANPKYINHIILLTDGRTYGDEEACYKLADHARQDNIGISGMGIGSEWNDIFLDHLSHLTGGSSMYVSQPQDIERLLQEKFDNLSKIFAENVTFSFETGKNVDINYAFRIQPETGPLNIEPTMQFGPILRDESLSVLFELKVDSKALGKNKTVPLLVGTLDVSSAVVTLPIVPINVNLSAKVSTEIMPEPPPQEILRSLSKLTLYRIQEKARKELENHNYDKATEHLKTLATRLLAQGEHGLAKTVLLEAENIERDQSFTEEGDKKIKYGTRALLLPGVKYA